MTCRKDASFREKGIKDLTFPPFLHFFVDVDDDLALRDRDSERRREVSKREKRDLLERELA